MAVTVGTTIGESEYTTLRSKMLTVMGTPSGTGTAAAGYLQATTAPAQQAPAPAPVAPTAPVVETAAPAAPAPAPVTPEPAPVAEPAAAAPASNASADDILNMIRNRS